MVQDFKSELLPFDHLNGEVSGEVPLRVDRIVDPMGLD